ncbi:hypothetical protein EDB92DRAFT_1816038 [Lactarius akahatsu]|uniref:Uncharacterized protein n=1 Tax=Lactarius akahatsu TaxID=416441 RepID=A0AAD4LHM1_9AGAM|nr:hypothetical protein EDB92DRAFT_1816038 [Lactarius akahatsu]
MQMDDTSNSDNGGESEVSQSQRELSTDPGFSITPRDADILQEYLQDFQAADTSLRTRIIEKAMAQLYLLRPTSAQFDKKVATKRIQKWFYNHYVRPRREYIKFTRKWSARNAFYHLHRDEVLELAKDVSGTEPGHSGFLGALQDATTALWNELSAEDQEEYVNAAKEWSEKTPPKHIQSRMASSMRERIIQDFQSQLYRTCGIRSIVLTAYEGEDNNLKVGFNDVSSVLQDGKDFRTFCTDWKSAALWEQWTQFGKKCFAKEIVDTPKKDLSRTIKTPIPIICDRDGCPELPTVAMSDGYKAKVVQSLLRDYCTAHIRYVTRKPKLIIPWGALVKDPSSWIIDECTPDRFEWKDPSKIQIGEVFCILDHWRHRQDRGIGPLMWVPTSPLFDNIEDPPRHQRSVRNARTLQSQGSDEEYFVLPNSQDSDQEDDKTGSVEPSEDSSDDDSSEKTDPTKSDDSDDDPPENDMAMGSPPLHMSHMTTEALPLLETKMSASHPHHTYTANSFITIPDMASPSRPQVRWQGMQVGHPLRVGKGKEVLEEAKRTVKVSEKVRNMDTGRGATKIHPDIWTQNR